MKLDKIIGTMATVIFIIFAVILIIQILLKLTGYSPTEVQLLYITMGVMASYLLATSYKFGVFVGEVKGFMRTTKAHMIETKQFMGDTRVHMGELKEFMSTTKTHIGEVDEFMDNTQTRLSKLEGKKKR